jgi:hypothetical protein
LISNIGDLQAVAALAETDGWLADERWVRTQTLREAVRIYRHVRAAGLASLDDLTVALDITLLELVRARPEPGSGLDRAQEAALHAITAVVDGMRLLPDAQPIMIEPAQVQRAAVGEDYDLAAYAAEVRLPCPVVYLDFADPGYAVPSRLLPADAPAFAGWTALLYGAFAWREGGCLAVMPMRGLITPDATPEEIFDGSVPQALFKVLYGPRDRLIRHSPANAIGIPTGRSSRCVYERQFEPGGATQSQQEALLAVWLAGDVVDVIRLLDDADFDAQPGPRGQRADNGQVVVPLVAHVNSEHRRGGDRP